MEPTTQDLTISQLAKASGVAAKTIRYYEHIGVLPAPTRTAAGYRQYDLAGVQRAGTGPTTALRSSDRAGCGCLEIESPGDRTSR
jgi:hypothetical protein